MVKQKNMSNRQGMALVAILLALLIVGFMCYLAFRSGKKSVDNSSKKFIEESGVDTSSYKGILDSTKKILHDAQDAETRRAQGL